MTHGHIPASTPNEKYNNYACIIIVLMVCTCTVLEMLYIKEGCPVLPQHFLGCPKESYIYGVSKECQDSPRIVLGG